MRNTDVRLISRLRFDGVRSESVPSAIIGNMKTIVISILSIALLGLAGCSTTQNSGADKPVSVPSRSAKPGPETVMVVYHVLEAP